MDKLTEQLRLKLRQLTDENRQLREDNRQLEVGRQKLLKDLQEKIVEANEAREMEAIYSSRLQKILSIGLLVLKSYQYQDWFIGMIVTFEKPDKFLV